MTSSSTPQPELCPLPMFRCACKGNWCRLLQKNLGQKNDSHPIVDGDLNTQRDLHYER